MTVINRLARLGGWLGEVAMAFMALSISYDVVMRYVFLAPTIWALEVNTFLLMFLCLLPAADTLSAGSQIQITFLTDRLQPAVRKRLGCIGDLAGVLFCVVMTWKGSNMAWAAYQHNDRMSTSLGTPLVIPYLFVPLGFGLLGLAYAGRLVSPFAGASAGKPSGPAPEVGQQL